MNVSFILLLQCYQLQFIFFFVLKTDSLAWRNYEWKRKQDHHICGNKEAVWWSHQANEKGWVSGIIGFNSWASFSNNLTSASHLGGQPWASTEIKASRKETGFSMVTFTHIYQVVLSSSMYLIISLLFQSSNMAKPRFSLPQTLLPGV